ncbi:hypothetical protein MSZK_23190 [Mycobacterium sp. shizuoka-1]|nr:hypothetical protein [Mycobacterium sp. shizuoka-1]GAY15593.1 hypothetical protein MSZK_23190 [Mycobacterium sp. shizuoka-1]
MQHWAAVAVAAVFLWLGMVLAISFLEAPLKFRAPGITIQLGLGIGRLVFRALNACEAVLAAIVVAALVVGTPGAGVTAAVLVAIGALLIQVIGVRPALRRRSDAVLADAGQAEAGRSRAHYVYVVFEVIKVAALLVGGVELLNF